MKFVRTGRRLPSGPSEGWTPVFAAGLVFSLLVGAALGLPAGAARAADAVAWIEADAASGKPPLRAIRIVRDGKTMAGEAELQACDEVRVVEPGVIVRITTAAGRETLYGGTQSSAFRVPCGDPGLPGRLMAVLRALAGESRTAPAAVMAATRSAAATSATGALLQVPSLGHSRTELVAGERALRIGWVGGKAPFSVRLTHADSHDTVALARRVARSPATLPPARLVPGRYRLVVRDAAGDTIDNRDIHVRAGAQLPAPPRALRDAALAPDDHTLLYAYWLEGLGDGAWVLEALQRVATLADPPPAARAWLQRYGADASP